MSGMVSFGEMCSACHLPGEGGRGPSLKIIGAMGRDAVVAAMKTGKMKPMAEGLSDIELNAIAAYATTPGIAEAMKRPPPPDLAADRCAHPAPRLAQDAAWNAWSPDPTNSRLQRRAGFTAAEVSRLKPKWAFATSGGQASPPTIVGGQLFLAAPSGHVVSLEAKTGCTYW